MIPIWVAAVTLAAGAVIAWAGLTLSRRAGGQTVPTEGEPLFFLRYRPGLAVVQGATGEKTPIPGQKP